MHPDNMKMRTKALLPVGVMGLALLGTLGFGVTRLAQLNQQASDLIARADPAAVTLLRSSQAMALSTNFVFGALVFDGESAEGKGARGGFAEQVSKAQARLDDAARLAPEKADEIRKLKFRFQAWVEKAEGLMKPGPETPGLEAGGKGKPEGLGKIASTVRSAGEVDLGSRDLINAMAAFESAFLARNAGAAANLDARSRDAILILSAGSLAAALLAAGFALWMSSAHIVRPLARLARAMNRLAVGDLTVEIPGRARKDEVGRLAATAEAFKGAALERARAERDAATRRAAADAERERERAIEAEADEGRMAAMRGLAAGLRRLAAGDLTVRVDDGRWEQHAPIVSDFNDALDKLGQAMRAIVASASAIQSGAHEISNASDDLSRRTEQQAASLEETAAALDEITATVKKSAEGAKHARDVVANADGDAKNGAVVVRQAVDAMDAIAKSSGQIGQIIGVIDEIAFQTNLLALNAGVEAARAGDAGRGFAVVASEVRALAQRSADAAKQIKVLISTSTTQVDIGVRLVAETGRALERIIVQVTEINGVVADIAAGAQEQATGLQQVNTAINQMDQTTQQNATMVEESNAASHSLSKETAQLSTLVEQFQVGVPRSDGAIRRDLRRVAPHVFQKPTKRPAAPGLRTALVGAGPTPRLAAVSGGSGADGEEGWSEF
jgi:methyl-accepting chemotaxis protein